MPTYVFSAGSTPDRAEGVGGVRVEVVALRLREVLAHQLVVADDREEVVGHVLARHRLGALRGGVAEHQVAGERPGRVAVLVLAEGLAVGRERPARVHLPRHLREGHQRGAELRRLLDRLGREADAVEAIAEAARAGAGGSACGPAGSTGRRLRSRPSRAPRGSCASLRRSGRAPRSCRCRSGGTRGARARGRARGSRARPTGGRAARPSRRRAAGRSTARSPRRCRGSSCVVRPASHDRSWRLSGHAE